MKSNLKARGGKVKEGEGFTVEVEMDGYTFIINSVGNILSIDEVKIGNAINADKYGNKVIPKNSSTKLADGTWKLFYQDENYTYIIHDELVPLEVSLEDKYGTNYDSGEVGIIGQALNPLLKEKAPEIFTLSASLPNMKGVAYLTDIDNWKEYAPDTSRALFAIGGPTVELFRTSFNASMPYNQKKETTPIQPILEFDVDKDGYAFSNMLNDNFKYTYSNGIYRKESSEACWYLASPEMHDTYNLLCIDEGERQIFCPLCKHLRKSCGAPFSLL